MVMSIRKLVDHVNLFEREWNAFQYDCTEQSQYLSQNSLNEFDKFNETFYNNYTMVIERLSKKIISVRSGQEDESSLNEFYEEVKYMTDLRVEKLSLYKNWIQITEMIDSLNSFPNLTILNKTYDFDKFLNDNVNEDLVVYSFTNIENCDENIGILFDMKNGTDMFGNNISFVAFNYEIYDRLAKHLVNRREKCVICLFSKSRLIAYDLKQFYENRKLIEEKVNQMRDKIGKYDIENVS